jgi:hypothetical protein
MADAINRPGTIAISWSSDGIGRVSLEQGEDDRGFCPVLPSNPIDTVGTPAPMLVLRQVFDSTRLYRWFGFFAGGGAAACGTCGSSLSGQAADSSRLCGCGELSGVAS